MRFGAFDVSAQGGRVIYPLWPEQAQTLPRGRKGWSTAFPQAAVHQDPQHTELPTFLCSDGQHPQWEETGRIFWIANGRLTLITISKLTMFYHRQLLSLRLVYSESLEGCTRTVGSSGRRWNWTGVLSLFTPCFLESDCLGARALLFSLVGWLLVTRQGWIAREGFCEPWGKRRPFELG